METELHIPLKRGESTTCMSTTKQPNGSRNEERETEAPRTTFASSTRSGCGLRKVVSALTALMLLLATVKSVRRDVASQSMVQEISKLKGSSANRECTCLSRREGCCRRTILLGHKMGYILVNELLQDFPVPLRTTNVSPARSFNLDKRKDYRHVILLRNIYESVVSGFLYHKSGRECWLDYNGVPYSDQGEENRFYNFMGKVEAAGFNFTYPRQNGRSFCQYLAEVNPNTAMAVYIAYSLNCFYAGMKEYIEEARMREARDGFPKSKFFCFEDASEVDKKEEVFGAMVEFLFPAGHSFTYSSPPRLNGTYEGGHSTSHDPSVRERLHAMIRSLDESIFQRSLAKLQEHIKCGD